MGEHPTSAAQPASEAVATTGLFLNFTSVIAIAVSLASWGASDVALAAATGIVAVLTFVASIVCFGVQARTHEGEPNDFYRRQVRDEAGMDRALA